MICAEDEIGLSDNHAGIMILPDTCIQGTPAADYFQPYEDFIFEIGLTPNRMDAMSHIGVAKDVCAYLAHHQKKDAPVKLPFKNGFKADSIDGNIEVVIENNTDCLRYSGISIQNITIAPSPNWLQNKLRSIGLKPINNIVDITNFILHETGQPLHAFDADKIEGNKVVVKNVEAGTNFITLDQKERKLFAEDLLICNAAQPMCIAGVYGGLGSGVSDSTTNIFLESAWFNPTAIRKTSFRHGLRTDAATRFEKGVDIGNTVNVLKRAALMMKEIAGGIIASDVIDIFPTPKEKNTVTLKYHYLKKLSGKNYHGDTIKNILVALGFEILKEGLDDIRISVPFSKPDITIAADIVEEIMRIDGLDNIEIPATISLSPAVETLNHDAATREKIAAYLVGNGFNEIFTNSITNAAYYNEDTLTQTVKMINSLSAELNVMRPSMIETGLESVAYNLNRKNNDIRFFEFGKTYTTGGTGLFSEKAHLAIYISGKTLADSWKGKGNKADIYYAKAIVDRIAQNAGLTLQYNSVESNEKLDACIEFKSGGKEIGIVGILNKKTQDSFDIKQPVLYVDIYWDELIAQSKKVKITYTGIAKFPAVQRDVAIVVDKLLKFEAVEKATQLANVNRLKSLELFDIFESEKLGAGKKSMAVSFTFQDEEKTLTDKEIDAMMAKIISAYEKELHAEIRK
jgi:phenylalanyl-tRNA synthetase beta chain